MYGEPSDLSDNNRLLDVTLIHNFSLVPSRSPSIIPRSLRILLSNNFVFLSQRECYTKWTLPADHATFAYLFMLLLRCPSSLQNELHDVQFRSRSNPRKPREIARRFQACRVQWRSHRPADRLPDDVTRTFAMFSP